MSATSKGRVTEEELDVLETVAHTHNRPWTMGVGSYTVRAMIEEIKEFRALLPPGTCMTCKGMGSDPVMGNDVPCGTCGGSGKVKV